MFLQFQSNFCAGNNSSNELCASPSQQQVLPDFTKRGEPRGFLLHLDGAYFWALCWHATLL